MRSFNLTVEQDHSHHRKHGVQTDDKEQ